MKDTPILPGSWLGLMGGGQLGRMFAQAAATMGYRVCVLEPDKNAPAAIVAEKHHLRSLYGRSCTDRTCLALQDRHDRV